MKIPSWNWFDVSAVVPIPSHWPKAEAAINVAVAGYGYWGQKLAAALRHQGATVIPVDPNQPNTRTWSEVLADPTVNGVVIATPEKTHAELTLAALQANKAVLVEKPAATTTADWQAVMKLAQQKQLPVLVDYTFFLSQGAQIWRQWQAQFTVELGELQTLHSVRLAQLTPVRIVTKGVPVWVDTAIHDLYLLRWLLSASTSHWQVMKSAKTNDQIVAATLTAKLNLIDTNAQFQADYSWIATAPQRTWLATFTGGTIRWERRGGDDWLQVMTTAGKVLAETTVSDFDPSPLDRTTQLFLAWVTVSKSKSWSKEIQTQWQKYWVTVQQDIQQLTTLN